MPLPDVRSPRQPRRVPGPWGALLLALALHAAIGFVIYWDDRPSRDTDPTARMGAAPTPPEPETDQTRSPESEAAQPRKARQAPPR